jgi:hypothetical protein
MKDLRSKSFINLAFLSEGRMWRGCQPLRSRSESRESRMKVAGVTGCKARVILPLHELIVLTSGGSP